MTWSRLRRCITGAGGFVLGALALTLALTTMASGAQAERAGALAFIVELLVALAAFYLVAAGFWGAWLPATRQACVRSVRVLLSWAVLVSASFGLALPVIEAAKMTRVEWVALISVLAYFFISLIAIVGIVRTPRLTIAALGVAAAYAGLSLAYAIWNVVGPRRAQLSGPAPALSFALSSSLLVAVLAAFLVAWPLRTRSGETAPSSHE